MTCTRLSLPSFLLWMRNLTDEMAGITPVPVTADRPAAR